MLETVIFDGKDCVSEQDDLPSIKLGTFTEFKDFTLTKSLRRLQKKQSEVSESWKSTSEKIRSYRSMYNIDLSSEETPISLDSTFFST